jgi:hypothetical protein
MRRNTLASFFVLAAICIVSVSPCLAESLEAKAMKTLQESVVNALPSGRGMTRIAVLDFKGDVSGVGNAITSAMTARTSYKIMERADFDRVLAEQGLQLKDIMDEKTRIRHGRLKGVQGLLMGSVYTAKGGFMSYHVRAYVKLVDVERGEIILSRDFDVSAVSPYRRYVVMGAAGLAAILLLCLLAAIFAGRRRRVAGERIIEEQGTHKKEMTNEIDRVIGHVSHAKTRLVETGHVNDAAEMKGIERSLMEMRRSVAGAPHGPAGLHGGRGPHHAVYLDREIFWKLEDLERLSGKISDMASSGDAGGVGREIGALKTAVIMVDGDLKDRRSRFI